MTVKESGGRALVTGASGFVGGHLCEKLRSLGWEVTALVREGSSRSVLQQIECKFLVGDLFATSAIARYAGGFDLVFHLAGVTRSPNAAGFDHANVTGTEKLADALDQGGFKGRMIHVSSLAAGGPAPPGRVRTEDDRDAPVSLYGKSKLAGERALRLRDRSFRDVVLRPGVIYGPREVNVMALLRGIARTGLAMQLGDGVTIQMTYVSDVVSACLAAANLPASACGRPYYIGRREPLEFAAVADALAAALGRKVRLVRLPWWVGDAAAWGADMASSISGRNVSPLGRDKITEMRARTWIADPALFETTADWQARVDLAEGLGRTLDWARQRGLIS